MVKVIITEYKVNNLQRNDFKINDFILHHRIPESFKMDATITIKHEFIADNMCMAFDYVDFCKEEKKYQCRILKNFLHTEALFYEFSIMTDNQLICNDVGYMKPYTKAYILRKGL